MDCGLCGSLLNLCSFAGCKCWKFPFVPVLGDWLIGSRAGEGEGRGRGGRLPFIFHLAKVLHLNRSSFTGITNHAAELLYLPSLQLAMSLGGKSLGYSTKSVQELYVCR